MDIERIYQRLPIALQNLAVSVEGWRINQKRYGPDFQRLLREYRAKETWSAEEIRTFRDARLAKFVARAARLVPHYRDLFRRLRLHPEEINGLEALSRLPILTKAEVQSDPTRFMPDDLSSFRYTMAHTSGTTGAGLRFPVTDQAQAEQWAVWWRYRLWHGIQLDEWCAYFGGRAVVPIDLQCPPYWRTNYPSRQLFFSGYHLSSRTVEAYADKLKRARIRWIHGYPSMLALFASLLLERGERIPHLRWITVGAETLLPQQADLIKEAFGVAPIQHYGMAEAVSNFSQCRASQLHVDESFAAVEFVPHEQESLRIVGTNLSNPAFPLLRYSVGDLVWTGEAGCACGYQGRSVRAVEGRIEDFVVTRGGARIGRLDHIFKDMGRVKEAQIHQLKPGEVTIRVVRGAGYGPEDELALVRSASKYLAGQVDFTLEYVKAIDRTPSGKLRFVVSACH